MVEGNYDNHHCWLFLTFTSLSTLSDPLEKKQSQPSLHISLTRLPPLAAQRNGPVYRISNIAYGTQSNFFCNL